jgi:hypothetical protein
VFVLEIADLVALCQRKGIGGNFHHWRSSRWSFLLRQGGTTRKQR